MTLLQGGDQKAPAPGTWAPKNTVASGLSQVMLGMLEVRGKAHGWPIKLSSTWKLDRRGDRPAPSVQYFTPWAPRPTCQCVRQQQQSPRMGRLQLRNSCHLFFSNACNYSHDMFNEGPGPCPIAWRLAFRMEGPMRTTCSGSPPHPDLEPPQRFAGQ